LKADKGHVAEGRHLKKAKSRAASFSCNTLGNLERLYFCGLINIRNFEFESVFYHKKPLICIQ